MPTPIAGIVGPSASNAQDGATGVELRQGHTGELIVSQYTSRYQELTARGVVFSAANQAAAAISVALATTYTGIGLYNPLGSNKMLVPLKWKFALSVAPAAIATIGLISTVQAAAPTGTTALGVRSNQVGNTAAAAAGQAFSAATILTPVWHQQAVDGFTAAALPAPSPIFDLDGSLVIFPGGFLAIGALTTVTGLGSISWAEFPLNING